MIRCVCGEIIKIIGSGSVNIEKNRVNYLEISFIRFIFGNIK